MKPLTQAEFDALVAEKLKTPAKVISSAPAAQPVVIRRAPSTAEQIWNELGDTMARLAGRWLDEYNYEDINDYKNVIVPFVRKHGGEITQMLKRPFGFVFKLNQKQYKITMSARGRYTLAPMR